MFKLNRLSCRSAFLLFCVFPTGLILTWVFFPTPTSTWEESLSNELGLDISIQQVSRPRPGTSILHGIELADLEVGSIAKLRIAEVVETGNRRVVLISQPEIDTDQLGHLLNKIDNRLLRQNGQCESRLRLIAPKLTIHPLHPDKDVVRASETFVDVKCDIDVGSVPRITLTFRRVGGADASPAVLEIERRREPGRPAITHWSLNTGDEFLPTWLLTSRLPSLRRFGENCEFRGLAWGKQTDSDFEGEVSGDLRGVDLYQLVQEQFPHTFSGTASVHLVRAKIHNGRLVNAAGSLKSSGGMIGRRLLEAAAKRWNLLLHNVADGAVIRFAAMDIGFEFDESTIRLTGNCGQFGTSWIMTDTGNPILSSHGVTTAPILSLVRVLVTQSDVQVPLTRETASLLSVFPIPAVKRSSNGANQPPSTTLRLEDSSFR